MSLKVLKCPHCGNILTYIEEKGGTVVCCGEPMKELVPGSVEASTEKHIPVITKEGSKVTVVVGSVEHPMLPEHSIKWIILETKEGTQGKSLEPGDAPKAEFYISESDEVLAAYEYCNLHGLWKA